MATPTTTINKTIKIGATYNTALFVLGDTINVDYIELIPKVNKIALSSLTKQALPINFKIYIVEDNKVVSWAGNAWADVTSATAGSLNSVSPDGIPVTVDISNAPAPVAGQVLTAISSTEATWGEGGGGGGGITPEELQQIYDEIARIFTLINGLTPSLNYVGEFPDAPTEGQLGTNWKQNALYKNSTNGKSYILTGDPLAWVIYIEDGYAFYLAIESSNGTAFKMGSGPDYTNLTARLFKNGAEITDITPLSWFSWRRVSVIPQDPPNDDATWNTVHYSGYNPVIVTINDIYARATFFCDVRV